MEVSGNDPKIKKKQAILSIIIAILSIIIACLGLLGIFLLMVGYYVPFGILFWQGWILHNPWIFWSTAAIFLIQVFKVLGKKFSK
jgi:hypothetical protein